MPRRSELQGIANNLASWFVSRNNDVNGYWALGPLYLHAKHTSQQSVIAPILPRPVATLGEPIRTITFNSEKLLVHMLQKQRLPPGWIASASILVEFESSIARPRFLAPHGTGKPHFCTATVTDDTGSTYRASTSAWCWPHNPIVESQRRVQGDA